MRLRVDRWSLLLLLTVAGAAVASAGTPPSTSTQPTQQGGTGTTERLISSEDFIASPFARFLASGDLPRALDALDALAKEYPNDPLILRYRAIVLDQLGRYDDALAIYDQLLAKDPNHVPTRFFRAQTLYHKGDRQRAGEELQWVVDHSPSKEYRLWAKEELRKPGATVERRTERKKFYVFGNTGWEYDTNVPLKASDDGLAAGGDQNASRVSFNLGLGYRAIQRRGVRLDMTYVTRQSLNDDSLNEFNFTSQELAVDGRKRVELGNRDVTLGARYELASGFLDGDLFSVNNEFRLSGDARLTSHTRTYVFNHLTIVNFGPDGSNPPQTSRDGFGYDLGAIQYFYSDDFRRHLFIGEELNVDQTRGDNFIRRGCTTRLGVHSPVPYVPKTDLDANIAFQFGNYPRFSSLSALDPIQRVDNNWNTYLALTYRLAPRVSTRVFWRYINANNRNDFFQYDRQVAGVQLLFTQYF